MGLSMVCGKINAMPKSQTKKAYFQAFLESPAKSFEEIKQIVETAGTNHTISNSNKKVASNWQLPYDFLASFLASIARWRVAKRA
jgi:hypothetical protein